MRQRAMLTLAIAGMFILATAAVSHANWYHKSESSEGSTSEMTSPGEPGSEAPQAETYEQQQPSEAGQLPPDANFRSGNDFQSGEPVGSVEAGGLEYRQGIDTGP